MMEYYFFAWGVALCGAGLLGLFSYYHLRASETMTTRGKSSETFETNELAAVSVPGAAAERLHESLDGVASALGVIPGGAENEGDAVTLYYYASEIAPFIEKIRPVLLGETARPLHLTWFVGLEAAHTREQYKVEYE